MRLHAVLFSAAILTASVAAQSASTTPHDSRTQVPAILLSRTQPLGKPSPQIATLNRPNPVCYAIRAYNFPTDPASDITKPTNITTCEPARDASLKSTSAPAVLVFR